MSRWVRVTPPTVRQYGTVVFLCIILGSVAIGAVNGLVGGGQPTGEGPDSPVLMFLGPVITVGVAAGLCTVLWRDFATGLYASTTALRIRFMFRTRTVPWSDIARVERRPSRLFGLDLTRDAIWIVLTTDVYVQTPVQRRNRGAIFQAQTGTALKPEQFDRAVQELRSYRESPNELESRMNR